MKKHYLSLIAFLVCINPGYSQDTVIEYNLETLSVIEIFPVPIDTSIHFENTAFSVGLLGNQILLNLSPPTTNLFPGTNFCDIERAAKFHDVTSFPFRTAIKLFGWKDDTLHHNCSGIMVSENFVLTSAHCLYSFVTQSWQYDSMHVWPGYDNGIPNEQLPASTVEKIYVFKSFLNKPLSNDIALLKLKKPIGQQIGWIGIAFSEDTIFFSEKVIHKLSYPSAPNPINPSLVYNGDTLYYNYGWIDVIGPYLGLMSTSAVGIPGQSGSSLFYTDNTEYYSFGVFSFASQYKHYQFTNKSYSQFKSIILTNPSGIFETDVKNFLKISPNPAGKFCYVESTEPVHSGMTLQIMDVYGRVKMMSGNISTNRVRVDLENLKSGIYFINVLINNNVHSGSKLIIK